MFTLAGLQPEQVDAFPKAPARTDERNQALHILGLYVVPLANRLALTALLSELDEQIIIIRDLAEKASAGRSPRAFDDLRQQLIRTGTDSQVINDIVNYAEDTTWWKHELIDFSEAPPPILGQITPQASLADTLRRGQIAEVDLGERFEDFRFLIRDRGSNFTASFDAVFQTAGTTILRTAVQAPRMNAICERLIGALRRELLDRTLILNRAHLRAVLAEYQEHYNTARPQQGLGQRVPDPAPAPRVTAADPGTCQIHRKPLLSGLINEYERAT